MRIYAHRGNLNGPNPKKENHPNYINQALKEGVWVEIDVWYHKKNWWLGHDNPQYKTCDGQLRNWHQQVIYHAKNIEALPRLLEDGRFHVFWHETDHYTVTSHGIIWVYPGKQLVPGCIAVLPEIAYRGNLKHCSAICTDYVHKYIDL